MGWPTASSVICCLSAGGVRCWYFWATRCWRTSGTGSSPCTGACGGSGTPGAARPAGKSSAAWVSAEPRLRLMAETTLPRVLLVDDDPDLCRLVQHVLQTHGYAPAQQVGTGREALGSLEDVDIVLLDQQLPDTSGLDVLDAIRNRPSPPAVVLVTAHGNESLVATALRRGADDYLAKDAALMELLPQI